MSRYNQLLDIIDEIKPRRIVEVGVARTVRAKEMVMRAYPLVDKVHYIGYDVFDTVGEYNEAQAFHQAAYNHKRVESKGWCARKLDNIVVGRHEMGPHPNFTFDLIAGDTRDTLHGKRVDADFVFIDGDHRIAAIRGDYEALKRAKVVVLDDYFEVDGRGCPDTNLYGCNNLVDEIVLNHRGRIHVELGREAEAGLECGTSRFAILRRR